MAELVFFTGNAKCMSNPALFREVLEKATEATRHVCTPSIRKLMLPYVAQAQRSRTTVLVHCNGQSGLAYVDFR